MWWLVLIGFALCIYKIVDSTREAQDLRREHQRLQEELGRTKTSWIRDFTKIQDLEQDANQLHASLESLSSKGKEKDAQIRDLRDEISRLGDEKTALIKAREQALLDAKRALSSINSSSKSARNALRQKEMAEEDRDAAYREMEEAKEKAAAAQNAAAEAIKERDHMLALKASVDAQSADNDRLRHDLHQAHEAQTKAEADRHQALQDMLAAQKEAAAAVADKNQAIDAQVAAEKVLSVWKVRAMEAESARDVAEDKVMETTQKIAHLGEKIKEVIAADQATQAEVETLKTQVSELTAQVADLKVQIDTKHKELNAANTEISRLEKELDEVQAMAQQEVLEVQRSLEAKIAENDGTLKSLASKLEATESENEHLQSQIEESYKLESALDDALAENEQLLAELKALDQSHEALKSEMEDIRQKSKSMVDEAPVLEELKGELQVALEDKAKAQAEAEALRATASELADVAESNAEKLKQLKKELDLALDAKHMLTRQVEDGERKLGMLRDLNATLLRQNRARDDGHGGGDGNDKGLSSSSEATAGHAMMETPVKRNIDMDSPVSSKHKMTSFNNPLSEATPSPAVKKSS